jgi:hypothetical protein
VLGNISDKVVKGKTKSMKFFHATKSLQTKKKRKWKWPFIDMLPYKEINSTHIQECSQFTTIYPKYVIWPTQHLQLGPMLVEGPNMVEKMLKLTYPKGDFNTCMTHWYFHKYGLMKKYIDTGYHGKVLCDQLKQYYPFVKSNISLSGVKKEWLEISGSIP